MGTYESRRAMHEAPSPGATASSMPATEHLGTEVTNEKKAIFVVSVLSLGTMAGSTPFAAPPDPTPGATLPTREQNLDADGLIRVREQGVADVDVTNDPMNVSVANDTLNFSGEVEVSNFPATPDR